MRPEYSPKLAENTEFPRQKCRFLTRSIVKAHGGRLRAEPNKPRGAVFQFTLSNEADPPPA
jgi:hypothetical protein